MIVQSAAPDGSHLVLTMEEHTATGAVLARHFGGTELFDRPEPTELFVELVAEHDRGWVPVDNMVERDPNTDLPWNVFDAPLAHSLTAGAGTIDYNERCHPYRGLLASMHISGLYNGRFGMNEPQSLGDFEANEAAALTEFLDTEQQRRDRLEGELAADPATAWWVERDIIMKCYKALQFFDMLALWLQVAHPHGRGPMVWAGVPGRNAEHVIQIEQLDDTRVSLDPYPFDTDGLAIVVTGRRLHPQPGRSDLAVALSDATPGEQNVLLVAGRAA